MAGRMGIMDKAYGNMKNRKTQDTTPTLDAQVVDLPKENENEKEIVIQRPDNDADKNVDLPAVSTGNNLIPPTNNPPVNLAALNGGEVAPMGNRDLAEDVEFTIDKQEPEGIEGGICPMRVRPGHVLRQLLLLRHTPHGKDTAVGLHPAPGQPGRPGGCVHLFRCV